MVKSRIVMIIFVKTNVFSPLLNLKMGTDKEVRTEVGSLFLNLKALRVKALSAADLSD